MIEHKIHNVPDSVCKKCPQLWEGECRAFCVPHSEEERIHRMVGRDWSKRLPCAEYLRWVEPKPPALDRMDCQTIVVLVFAFGVLLTLVALVG